MAGLPHLSGVRRPDRRRRLQAVHAVAAIDGARRVVGARKAEGGPGEVVPGPLVPPETPGALAGPVEALVDQVRLPRPPAQLVEPGLGLLEPLPAVEAEGLSPGGVLGVLARRVALGQVGVEAAGALEQVPALGGLGRLPESVVGEAVARMAAGELHVGLDRLLVAAGAHVEAGEAVEGGRPAVVPVEVLVDGPRAIELAGAAQGAAEGVPGMGGEVVAGSVADHLPQLGDGAVVAVAGVDLGPRVALVDVVRPEARRRPQGQGLGGVALHQLDQGLAAAPVVAAEALCLGEEVQQPGRRVPRPPAGPGTGRWPGRGRRRSREAGRGRGGRSRPRPRCRPRPAAPHRPGPLPPDGPSSWRV